MLLEIMLNVQKVECIYRLLNLYKKILGEWLVISERTWELRYQAKEPNMFLYKVNNLIIICGIDIYKKYVILFE